MMRAIAMPTNGCPHNPLMQVNRTTRAMGLGLRAMERKGVIRLWAKIVVPKRISDQCDQSPDGTSNSYDQQDDEEAKDSKRDDTCKCRE